MDNDRLAIYTIAISGMGMYGAFLPPVSALASDVQSDSEKAVIRESEFFGTLHLLTVAAITSYFVKSSLPFVIAILIGASMFITYEYALARVPSGKGT